MDRDSCPTIPNLTKERVGIMFIAQVYKDGAYRSQGKPKKSLLSAVDILLAVVRSEPALVRVLDDKGEAKYKRDFRKNPITKAPQQPVAFVAAKQGKISREQVKGLEAQTTKGQL